MAQVIRAAEPTFKMALLVTGAVACAAIGGGIVAVIWDAKANTQFDLFGMNLTTTHVGVAMVGLGIAASVIVGRKIVAAIERIGSGAGDVNLPRRRRSSAVAK